MSGIFDDLPPHLVGPLVEQFAKAYGVAREFGFKAGRATHADDVAKAYGLGYDAGVHDTEAANLAEAAAIYQLGHDAGVREANRNEYHRGWAAAIGDAFGLDDEPETPSTEGVDPVTVEACRRVSERLSDSGTVAARPHRHTMPWLWQPKTKATLKARRAGQ